MRKGAPVTCYIALGSNLDEPEQQLARAVKTFQSSKEISVISGSAIYRSAPLGPQNQPDYYNAVIKITTWLEPEPLLNYLQSIETAQGRVRKERWGARTLDLDILLYGDQTIQTSRLTIPHTQMCLRNFVMIPLNDIAKGQCLPGGVSIEKQCHLLGMEGLYPTGKTLLKL